MTRLADTNSPADLAAVVADASGLGGHCCVLARKGAFAILLLHRVSNWGHAGGGKQLAGWRVDSHPPLCAGRWNQERRAAAEELARTHQAIAVVQAKLQTLVGGSRQACRMRAGPDCGVAEL